MKALQQNKGIGLGSSEEIETLNNALKDLYWISPALNENLGKVEPSEDQRRDGLVAFADGTNWKPNGSGDRGTWRWNATSKIWEKEISTVTNTITETLTNTVEAKVYTLRSSIGNFSRDTALASGTQSVSGIGGVPVVLLFLSVSNATDEVSIGFDNLTAKGCIAYEGGVTAWNGSSTYSICDIQAAAHRYDGYVQSLDSDGFTISWTKTGSPTGTLISYYMALYLEES